jgi:hypothetical protein
MLRQERPVKSLHHLIPICTIALCALFMASAAAAYGNTHTTIAPGATVKQVSSVSTVGKVSTVSTSSKISPSTGRNAPPMGTIRENDNQVAGQYCIAHWQDSFCRGVLALHDEALKLQQKDGGKLTPEHRQELQDKLDAVLADVQSKLDAERPPSG